MLELLFEKNIISEREYQNKVKEVKDELASSNPDLDLSAFE